MLRDRGRRLSTPDGRQVLITVHPSSILRAVDSDERRAAMAALVADLQEVGRWLRDGLAR